MKGFFVRTLIISGLFLGLTSCKEDDPIGKSTLVIPNSYGASNFEANTVEENLLTQNFNDLVSLMKTGQDTLVQVKMSDLLAAWNKGGANSVKAKSGWYVNEVETVYFPDLMRNSGKTYHPDHGDTATIGGIFGGRLLDKGAFEILQAVDKGAYGSLYLHQIVELAKDGIDLKDIDKMLALYGAHPDFPNTPNAANATNPDRSIANYAARRDKNDGTGFYSKIKYDFLMLQAACAAGSEYREEKNQAFTSLIQNIEKSIMATSINYMYATIEKLSKTKPTDEDKAGALHDLSEAISFIYGFKNLQSSHIQITTTQVEEILALLEFEGSQVNPLYHFTNDPISYLPQIMEAQMKMKAIYNFTDQEMNDFKSNWVSVQGR